MGKTTPLSEAPLAPSLPPLVDPSSQPAPHGTVNVGVIDVGSNSVRLVVAEVVPGSQPRVLVEEREPVRLGEGVFHTGQLARGAVERTVTALKRFAALAKARGVVRIHARGTCALREAEDRGPFLARVQEEAGLEVHVLTGAEEARLIARGVLSGLSSTAGELVLVDMGGGSVEVSRAVEGTLTEATSLKLGAVRLSEMFLRSDPPAQAEMDLLRHHARQTVKNVVTFDARAGARCVGSAGTINALATLARNGKGSATVTVDAMEDVVLELARLPLAKRRSVPNLESRRADIIVAGGLALLEVFRHLGVKEVEVTKRGLKEGLLLEAVESLGMALPAVTEPERARVEGAMAVARRYQVDEAHAQQVAALACRLFENLKELHGLKEDARSELEVAALLHDIGQFVSFEKHHKHGAYLLQHTDLAGFSEEAVARMAAIVRYHRRGAPKDTHAEWAALSRADRDRVLPLAAILRIADGLDRTHHRVVQDLTVEVGKKEVVLRVKVVGGPADMEAWAAGEKGDLFQEVFGRTFRVEVQDGSADARRTPVAPTLLPVTRARRARRP